MNHIYVSYINYEYYIHMMSEKSALHTCITWDRTYRVPIPRGGGLGLRPKKMYGERLGDGVEYHLMKPTPGR